VPVTFEMGRKVSHYIWLLADSSWRKNENFTKFLTFKIKDGRALLGVDCHLATTATIHRLVTHVRSHSHTGTHIYATRAH